MSLQLLCIIEKLCTFVLRYFVHVRNIWQYGSLIMYGNTFFCLEIRRYMPTGVIELYFKRIQHIIYLWHRKNRWIFDVLWCFFSLIFRVLSVFIFAVLLLWLYLPNFVRIRGTTISVAFLHNFPNVQPAWYMPFEHNQRKIHNSE